MTVPILPASLVIPNLASINAILFKHSFAPLSRQALIPNSPNLTLNPNANYRAIDFVIVIGFTCSSGINFVEKVVATNLVPFANFVNTSVPIDTNCKGY